jgi:hypothetical protein
MRREYTHANNFSRKEVHDGSKVEEVSFERYVREVSHPHMMWVCRKCTHEEVWILNACGTFDAQGFSTTPAVGFDAEESHHSADALLVEP